MVIQKVKTTNYTITLSEDEATMMKCIMGHICGQGKLRTFGDDIYNKLESIGIDSHHYNQYISRGLILTDTHT